MFLNSDFRGLIYPDNLSVAEELKGNNKLPIFCEKIDKRSQISTRRLDRAFPDPLYRVIIQTPMTCHPSTARLTPGVTESTTPYQIQPKSLYTDEDPKNTYEVIIMQNI